MVENENLFERCGCGKLESKNSQRWIRTIVKRARIFRPATRRSGNNKIVQVDFSIRKFIYNSFCVAIIFFYYIDLRHWREDELLLNKGSRFLVTGLDKENGFINVKYLGG